MYFISIDVLSFVRSYVLFIHHFDLECEKKLWLPVMVRVFQCVDNFLWDKCKHNGISLYMFCSLIWFYFLVSCQIQCGYLDIRYIFT